MPTGKESLRDAAIACFAADGFDVSVRDIAQAAGVTAGLITHHFGSKRALRDACDVEALRRFREIKGEGMAAAPAAAIGMLARLDEFAPTFVYILRSIREGGIAGMDFLEHFIDSTREVIDQAVADGTLRQSRDPEARLRYIVTNQIGGLLIQLDLRPGIELSQTAAAVRTLIDAIALPSLELYTEGILVDRSYLDEYLIYSSDPAPGETSVPEHTHPRSKEAHVS